MVFKKELSYFGVLLQPSRTDTSYALAKIKTRSPEKQNNKMEDILSLVLAYCTQLIKT